MVTGTQSANGSATELDQIGAIAGRIWQFLDGHGPATLSKLVKGVEAPRDSVMQGVGWLAREGKIRFEGTPRSKLISLA